MAVSDDADVEAAVSRERFDIVVIGAGVAGAAFAAGVAGRRVLLVERAAWPREKVCGCCLNGAAVGSLDRLGLMSKLAGAATSLERVVVRARGREAAFERTGGLAVSRGVLDAMLVDLAVERGVLFQPETSAAVLGPGPEGGWVVRLRDKQVDREVVAQFVVAADGLSGGSLDGIEGFASRVNGRSWFGVGGMLANGPTAPGVIEMNIGSHGYVGLVRLGSGTVNLAAAMDPEWTKRIGGPAPAVAAIMKEAGVAAFDLEGASLRGTGLLTRRRERVASPGLLVIGDAAGYVEPFTGEGMAWGLAGAAAAAEMVAEGLSSAELAAAWDAWHTAQVKSRQRTCAVVRSVLRRPWLVGAAIAVMGSVPAAARAAGVIARRLERPYGGVAAMPGAST